MPLDHQQYRRALRCIRDAVVMTDLRRTITFMNPAAESMTGWSANEAVGRNFVDVFVLVDEEQQPTEEPVTRIVADGRPLALTALFVVRRDGVATPIAGSGAPVWLDDGGVEGAIFVIRDASSEEHTMIDAARLVSEAERLRREVSRTEDARAQLFAMLGHELRNPLAPIVSSLELVRRRASDSIGRELAIIERNVARVVRLVDEFIELPALTRAATRDPESQRTHVVRRPRRVLIVDDNVDAAETLAESLSDLGVESHAVFHADSALSVAARLKPTLAILDIGLPDIDGYELAQRLRKLDGLNDVLLVALTGLGQPSDRARARAAGFDAHVVKPITASNLLAVIATLEDGRATPN